MVKAYIKKGDDIDAITELFVLLWKVLWVVVGCEDSNGNVMEEEKHKKKK